MQMAVVELMGAKGRRESAAEMLPAAFGSVNEELGLVARAVRASLDQMANPALLAAAEACSSCAPQTSRLQNASSERRL